MTSAPPSFRRKRRLSDRLRALLPDRAEAKQDRGPSEVLGLGPVTPLAAPVTLREARGHRVDILACSPRGALVVTSAGGSPTPGSRLTLDRGPLRVEVEILHLDGLDAGGDLTRLRVRWVRFSGPSQAAVASFLSELGLDAASLGAAKVG